MLTQTHKPEQAIGKWMLDIAKDGGVERFDDLHIDEVDENWKPRERWIKAGIEAYQIALDLRNGHNLPFVVSVTFSLEASERICGIDFQTHEEFQRRLDHTPPSLYLFDRGKEPWGEMSRAIKEGSVASDAIIRNLDSTLLDGSKLVGNCYYLEFKRSDGVEYSRSVVAAG